jgi:hypothetical protein
MDQVISDRVTNSSSKGTERYTIAESPQGLIQTWVEHGVGVGEESVRATFGLLEDIRSETEERVNSTFDWVEGFDRTVFRLARKVVGRINSVATRVISGSEHGWLTLFGAIRRTTRGAAGLASDTVITIVGDRRGTLSSAS